MRAFLFPGQGSQKVGMSAGLPRRRFDEADAALGFPLSKIIAEGPEAELTRTANTQPAILTVSIAWLDELAARGVTAEVAAGHSLGEYAALVWAGALSFGDAVRLVHLRGKFMQEAVPEGQGAMAAIIGLEGRSVADTCREASETSDGDACQPANFNGAGQVVIAGHKSAVERAMQMCKDKGAKMVKALPVSAPFHSALMAPAAERLREELDRVTVSTMAAPIVANVTAEAYRDRGLVKDLLARQVTGSVRWEESVHALVKMGVTEAYEVGPGNVLRGLMKRIAPTVTMIDLPNLASLGASA
jgi:[acyl-carrier-protein] S-malonyltransferase